MSTNLLSVKERPTTVFSEIKDWFKSIHYFNEDSFVTRIRSFQITSFSFFLFNSFYNFISNLVTSYIITAVACMALLLVRYLIDNNKVKQAYNLMLVLINCTLITLSYFEGLGSGAFLFFFPTFFSFIFLADKQNQIFTYFVCISAFLITILLTPYNSEIAVGASQLGRQHFVSKIFMSFTLIAWMAYHLVNENNRKQAMIKNKEVFLDTIFNSSLHTDIIVDLETYRISDSNKGSSRLFAFSDRKALLGIHVRELFADLANNTNDKLLHEMLNPEVNFKGELMCLRSDGSQFPASINIVPFKYQDKVFKKITILDITEKNQILEDLKIAKKTAEESAVVKSQFLSHMSHELRTPLNGIIGSVNLLLQDNYLPTQKEQLGVLKFSSEHMLNLINDVLDLSKLDANKMELEKAAVDIPKFIDQIAATFEKQFEEKGISFNVNVDDRVQMPLMADPTRLNQVLTNLISNAFKFTNNGSVTLEVQAVTISSDFQTLQFSVTDTGIGISAEKQDRIFEQFTQADVKTTRRYGGTGLGLTISQRIVDIMGGKLQVESKYTKGSKFFFYLTLPVYLSKKKAFISDGKPLSENVNLRGFKVLIAEDNPINMMIATKFLDKWGVVYEKAKNGLEAVSLFENNNYDMILMDLDMPEMDGYQALTAIREMNPSIPAIAFTAAVFDNMKESLSKSGFNDYVQKPFRPDDLQNKLIGYSELLKKRA